MDQLGRARRLIEGADYMHDSTQSQSKAQRGSSKLKRTVTNQSGQVRTTPAVPNPQNPNASASSRARTPVSKPNPFAAKPTGRLTGPSAPSARGGILTGVAGALSAAAVPWVVKEATAGARVIAGDPNAHLPPNIKSVNNTNFDISTEAGRNGYNKAKNTPAPAKVDNTDLNPRIERKPGPFDEGYVKPNTTMEPTEKATLSEYLNPGRNILPQQTDTVNENNVRQQGRQLSGGVSAAFVPEYANSSFNDLLAAQGNQRYTGFNSSQLQGAQGNPFSGAAPKTQSFNTEAESVTGNSLADFGGDGSAAFASSRETTANDTFNPDAARIEGGSSRKAGGSLSDALADKAGINSYMSKFSSGDRQRAASSAFLNAEDSLSGLQARDAVNDVVYAGGQHYMRDGDGTQKLDRADARQVASGSAKAQDFLQKKTADVVAAVKQSPTLLEQGAKDGAFQQDKPMFSGSTPAIGGAVEFDNNNDNTLPTFGNNGGYKSGFKKIDTSMPSMFG